MDVAFEQALMNSMASFNEEAIFQDMLVKTAVVQKEVDVRGDGNCLFRCIAVAIWDSQDYHAKIRQNMINFVTEHKNDYINSPYLDFGETIDSWIGKMSNCGMEEFEIFGEYGDSLAIEILSTMLNRPIIVEMHLFDSHAINYDRFNDWNGNPTLHLILRGQHYTLRID